MKIYYLCGFVLLVAFTGCPHNTPNSNFNTPITLPVEAIKSDGTIIFKSFGKDKIITLEKELEKIFVAAGVKGISASVGIPDSGIWCSAQGVTGNPLEEKIAADLQFSAGSIGKIFTSIVILNLFEEGRLNLNSPVLKWFPEISWANRVTVNHLLTHTSGIASFDNTKEYESNKYLYHNPGKLLSYLTKKALLFEPGEHYDYSNTGYLMLGIIIERVSGISYKEAVERYIINRIDLHQTEAITSETINDLIVKGHHKGKVLSEAESSVVPFASGSIASTPRDLVIFLQALMRGKLLSKGSLQKMFSDMNLMTDTQSTYYGKGIMAAVGTPAGTIIGHTGGIKGFGASLFYHPERNIFVCVMMNDDIKSVDPVMFKLLEAMMGK